MTKAYSIAFKQKMIERLTGKNAVITIRIDDDLLAWFKFQVDAAGGGNYQSLINAALREHTTRKKEPLEATLRRVLREELRATT